MLDVARPSEEDPVLIDVERAQSRERDRRRSTRSRRPRRPAAAPPGAPTGPPRALGRRVDVLDRRQKRMDDPGLRQDGEQATTPCPGNPDLSRAPGRLDVARGHDAHDGVRPAQALVQPLLPLVADGDAVLQIAVQEGVVAVLDEPAVHLGGERRVGAGMAHERLRHRPSRRGCLPRSHRTSRRSVITRRCADSRVIRRQGAGGGGPAVRERARRTP